MAWCRAVDKKLKDAARAREAYARVPQTFPHYRDAQTRRISLLRCVHFYPLHRFS
jgi:hypothetical protein